VPTFVDFMGEFLVQHNAGTVVEIGSDTQLRLANRLSGKCKRYLSVNFPQDCQRLASSGWYEMGKDIGSLNNLEMVEGDATRLSEVVPRAEVIILHNVLLDSRNGEDTRLAWQVRNEEKNIPNEEYDELVARFKSAKEKAYQEFLKVAKPGYIVEFQRHDPDNEFWKFLTETMKIDQSKIERKPLMYDEENRLGWEVFVISNQ
jgi:hypothetical protein